jgi:hypothetical protein
MEDGPAFAEAALAKERVRGMIGKGMGAMESLNIPLPIIALASPFVATERAHWRMLSQRAEFVEAMMTPFFKTRNPCKH